MLEVLIESFSEAYQEFKGICLDEWKADYRFAARNALKEVSEERMRNMVDAYLEELRCRDVPGRKNGYYFRYPSGVIRSYPTF